MNSRLHTVACLSALLMLMTVNSRACADEPAADVAAISGSITFLYYSDLTAAADFYGQTLGLRLTMDEDWVKIFAITDGSSVGLVKQGHGFHEPAADKPVMLSMITPDVDDWHERLERAGARIIKPLPPVHIDDQAGNQAGKDSSSAPIRGFIVADPGGYTVEFFTWQTAGVD